MPKTLTIDGVNLLRTSVFRGTDGTVRVEAVYHLMSGTTIVRTMTREMGTDLSPGQLMTATAAFDGVLSAVERLEL
ncbi:MAG: hypothetical protein HY331_16205 [Chloroflexi bacterium]|nr:hypothetical protein [Chloroflexota bacterium]